MPVLHRPVELAVKSGHGGRANDVRFTPNSVTGPHRVVRLEC